MATRRKKSRPGATAGKTRKTGTRAQTTLVEGVQQIWLAGMGAIARAQKEGPGAFQDAVADGLALLNKSRSTAEKIVRDAFESAQDSVQARLGDAREQAGETWENLEALFQSRVHRALQQIGVPSAEEVRLLTQRVAELNENVKALAARPTRGGPPVVRRRPPRKAARGKAARRKGGRAAR